MILRYQMKGFKIARHCISIGVKIGCLFGKIYPQHIIILHIANTEWSNANNVINSSQVKIKYGFSKPFPPCDCGYVQQNMIILDILTRPFNKNIKV